MTNLYCTFVYEGIDGSGEPITVHEAFPPTDTMTNLTATEIRSAAFVRMGELKNKGKSIEVIMPKGVTDG
tara:strand:- start:439 stop:648 length:210 start_codon:yes stop_codon:yes gene_type:complete